MKRGGSLRRLTGLRQTGFHRIPDRIRRQVERRDHGECQARGLMDVRCWGPVEPHHVWPRGRGGPDTLENLLSLCRAHHRAVHDRPWDSVPLGLLKGR